MQRRKTLQLVISTFLDASMNFACSITTLNLSFVGKSQILTTFSSSNIFQASDTSNKCSTSLKNVKDQQYNCTFIFTACIVFLPYLDDVMCAVLKNWELVIQDWYFRGRMEMISVKKKGTKRRSVEILFKNYVYIQ